jgi:hypothetical protein
MKKWQRVDCGTPSGRNTICYFEATAKKLFQILQNRNRGNNALNAAAGVSGSSRNNRNTAQLF